MQQLVVSCARNIVQKPIRFNMIPRQAKIRVLKYGSAYVAVDRCKGCAQCVWVCDNMAKHKAIKMEMIDQIGDQALTVNITYQEKNTKAVLASPWQS